MKAKRNAPRSVRSTPQLPVTLDAAMMARLLDYRDRRAPTVALPIVARILIAKALDADKGDR